VDSRGATVPLTVLAKEPCIAIAGIANPDAFFEMLRAQGVVPQACHALPDHFDFLGWRNPAAPGQRLLCTEKDAVKLWVHEPGALAVPLEFEPEAAFLAAFDACLDARLSSRDGHQTA
ncbi:MAG: tetraacyldisaccharide 4'-kinase, partial [Comamonadaceae bacterium]